MGGYENGYGLKRSVLKTGVENDIFWSEIRSGFGEPGGTPHREFPVVPPSGGQEQGVNHVIIIIAQNITLDDSFWLLFTYVSNPSPLNTAFVYRGMPLH